MPEELTDEDYLYPLIQTNLFQNPYKKAKKGKKKKGKKKKK